MTLNTWCCLAFGGKMWSKSQEYGFAEFLLVDFPRFSLTLCCLFVLCLPGTIVLVIWLGKYMYLAKSGGASGVLFVLDHCFSDLFEGRNRAITLMFSIVFQSSCCFSFLCAFVFWFVLGRYLEFVACCVGKRTTRVLLSALMLLLWPQLWPNWTSSQLVISSSG